MVSKTTQFMVNVHLKISSKLRKTNCFLWKLIYNCSKKSTFNLQCIYRLGHTIDDENMLKKNILNGDLTQEVEDKIAD